MAIRSALIALALAVTSCASVEVAHRFPHTVRDGSIDVQIKRAVA
jgi:hypothetical protein